MNGIKPKLLIFINTLQSGGAERVVSLLLEHLKDDFEIHLALYSNIIEYKVPPEIKILNLQQPLVQDKTIRFLKLPIISWRVYRYCKKNKINISVAFLYRPCYINALMKSFWGYKGHVIMCERTHQTTMQQSHSSIYRMFSKFMVMYSYKRADLVLANSYAMQTDLVENFKIKTPVRVIYNPIDLNFIKTHINEPTEFVFEKNIFHFVNVGGFRKEKNHLLLIQAFFIIKNLPCKLLIVGGGVMENELKQKVHDLGLMEKVIFCGFDKNPFKYVYRSDCFVLSSDVEGFPNVLIEALACGKPVISTDCSSGPRELLAPASDLHHRAINNYEIGEYGLLTPVNDVTALAAAMKKIYEDESLRDAFQLKAAKRAEQFDVDEIKQYFHVAFTGL
ncbi:MAG: glycosyltransferase [Ferruginibacter sp.]|nr:glycosyltransferase [Bacteroidota bacterium]MBX2917783.1 glycosyltransferase [Ferruginibacter sp.]MCB0709969.1 glycosyltransferase [Chitinophagaceae bacterium]MCC7378157.1 glycosyltransferase [Chitinophagaceae bacterium]